MKEREVLTVPSERVAIDIVGPFPKAKGGVQYLFTCVDIATSWPEAIPLMSTTANVIVRQLKLMFARNGFPAVIVSDNGTQFCSSVFKKFLKEHGIRHVKSAPYHPQGNGMVERFHGTLNKLIAKIISKGKLGRSGVHGTLFHKVYPMRVQWVISICAYARVGAKHSVTITVQVLGTDRIGRDRPTRLDIGEC